MRVGGQSAPARNTTSRARYNADKFRCIVLEPILQCGFAATFGLQAANMNSICLQVPRLLVANRARTKVFTHASAANRDTIRAVVTGLVKMNSEKTGSVPRFSKRNACSRPKLPAEFEFASLLQTLNLAGAAR